MVFELVENAQKDGNFEIKSKDLMKKEVLNYLILNKENFIKVKKIISDLKLFEKYKHKTYVGCYTSVRYGITLLLLEGFPIIAKSKGYCYTENKLLISEYIENLSLRQKGIQNRINSLTQFL